MKNPEEPDFSSLSARLHSGVEAAKPLEMRGRVLQVVGTIIKAYAPGTRIGELCSLRNPWDDKEVLAEVVQLE